MDEYKNGHCGLAPWEKKWLFKISWDNTDLFNYKSEGLFMQLMNVQLSQSPIHVREIGRLNSSESNQTLATLLEKSELNQLVYLIKDTNLKIEDKPIEFFACADWPALIYELGGTQANTRFLDDETCFMCNLKKDEIRYKYIDDTTHIFPISKHLTQFPKSTLYSLPLRKRRYCWMHGITCILSNTCKLLYQLFPDYSRMKSQFIEVMEEVSYGWTLEHYSLFPSSMKMFFQKNIHEKLAKLFESSQLVAFQESKFLPSLTNQETVETLLDCIRVFKDFAYRPFPLRTDFKTLDVARNTFLKIYALNKWRLEVTTHFLLNHGLEFLQEDLSAYHTLQESIEHHNQVVKKHAENVFKNGKPNAFGYNRNLNLYQRLRINQMFSFLELPFKHEVVPHWHSCNNLSYRIISPPKHLIKMELSEWGKKF